MTKIKAVLEREEEKVFWSGSICQLNMCPAPRIYSVLTSGLPPGYDKFFVKVAISGPDEPTVRVHPLGRPVMYCWDFHNCGEKKENCPAFPGSGQSCALLSGTIGTAHSFYFQSKE
jgi:hypothetical protein